MCDATDVVSQHSQGAIISFTKFAAVLVAVGSFTAFPAVSSAQSQTPCDNGNPTDLCTTANVVAEPPGVNCPSGGLAFTLNGTTYYICNGSTGASGADGIAGTDGANGVDGVSGTSGVDGTAGTEGVNGLPGVNGINGVSTTDCISRRTFKIRVRERAGHRLRHVRVTANGVTKRVKRVHKRLTTKVSFVGYRGSRGQIVPVLIRGWDHGKFVRAVRLYRICTPSQGVSVLNIPTAL